MSLVLTDGARTIEAIDGDPGPAGGWFLVGRRAGISGWWDGPGVRRATTARPLAHGNFPAPGYRSGRGIGLSLGLVATSRADLEAKRALVLSMLADGGDGTLTVSTEEGESLSATVGLGSGPLTRDVSTLGMVAQVELYAPDPLRYGAPVSTISPLPERIGGLEFPLFGLQDGAETGYLEWGPRGDTGRRVLSNPGTASVAPTARVVGPLPLGFSLRRADTGETLTWAGALSADEWVDVDFRTKRVRLMGTADRTHLVTSGQWWTVPAATDVEAAFTAPSYDAAASVTWTLAPGWW